MNYKVAGCLLAFASMAAAQGPRGFIRPGGAAGRPGFGPEGRVVTGAPFSAVEVRQFQEHLGDGNVINRTSQTTLYRDSQGRTRTEVTVTPAASTGKQPFTMITINDPVAGERHELDSSTMISRTIRIPRAHPSSSTSGGSTSQSRPAGPAAQAARPSRPGAAIAKSDLGSAVKNGVMATGSRETQVIAAGRIGNAQAITVTRESWYSTEIKRAVEVKVSDPQHGDSTTELTNLVVAEPSAALFTVPSGYTEKAVGRGGRGGAFVRRGPPPAAQ